jgi:hypothetical protein
VIDTVVIWYGTGRKIKKKRKQEFLRLKKDRNFVLDDKIGLRVGGNASVVFSAEVSLSRAVHRSRTNSKPVTEQDQIDQALKQIEKKISVYAGPPDQEPHFTRVDLAWEYRTPPEKFFLAHRFATHPLIHKCVCLFRQKDRWSGISWLGGKMKIRFYDKLLEGAYYNSAPKHIPGSGMKLRFPTVRIEIELEGDPLKRWLGHGGTVKGLNLEECYRAYRSLLMRFRDRSANLPRVTSLEEAAFLAEDAGLCVFDQLRMSGKTRATFLAKYKRWQAERGGYKVDWSYMLPQQFPPPNRVCPKTTI